MVRIARVIAPGVPHHITQRGNRRLQTFFRDEDYLTYIDFMASKCNELNVVILAYCLMPNHTHMIAVPPSKEALISAISESHRRYTRHINLREGWSGHLWQGRFSSFPMDDVHLYTGVRYVELNPVRAGLVKHPWEYRWSSAAAHIEGRDDKLVKVDLLLKEFGDWKEYLTKTITTNEIDSLKAHERTGRPLGSEYFLTSLEEKLGRRLKRQKPGPKSI